MPQASLFYFVRLPDATRAVSGLLLTRFQLPAAVGTRGASRQGQTPSGAVLVKLKLLFGFLPERQNLFRHVFQCCFVPSSARSRHLDKCIRPEWHLLKMK